MVVSWLLQRQEYYVMILLLKGGKLWLSHIKNFVQL